MLRLRLLSRAGQNLLSRRALRRGADLLREQMHACGRLVLPGRQLLRGGQHVRFVRWQGGVLHGSAVHGGRDGRKDFVREDEHTGSASDDHAAAAHDKGRGG